MAVFLNSLVLSLFHSFTACKGVPLFRPQAGRRAVFIKLGRVDHHRLRNGCVGSQAIQHLGEAPLVVPALTAVVEGLRRAIFLERIVPSQAIAINEYYSNRHSHVIDAQLAVALRKKGSNRTICASVSQKRLLIVRSPCGG